MRGLAAHEVVELWDRGAHVRPASRALAVLVAADRGVPLEASRSLTVGERDARLLAVRTLTFGARLAFVSDCPACAARVELEFTAGELGLGGERPAAAEAALTLDGHRVVMRAVTAGDLVAVEEAPTPEAAATGLMQRCVISIDGDPDASPPDALRPQIDDALEALDEDAAPEIATTCPECGHAWVLWLDLATFFWEKLEIQAPRLLADVAALGRHYGWSERDILAMSARRRRFYLEAMAS